MVRLSDSLSNFSTPLLRLVSTLEKQPPRAVAGRAQAELIAQTGVTDPASVRLKIKENRKLPPGEIGELVGSYLAGTSQAELALRYGLHVQTVKAHLHRQGVVLRPVAALSEEQELKAVGLYVNELLTLREIAARLGVSDSTIRTVLERHGVARRPRTFRRER